MSYSTKTTLRCSNPEVVKACNAAIKNIDYPDDRGWKDGDNRLGIYTVGFGPHDEVKAISEEFPDDTITCEYAYSCDRYSIVHVVEYRNGEANVVNIEPSYTIGPIPLVKDSICNEIYDKAISLCRKLDTVEKDTEGHLVLNWFPEEVCIKFNYDDDFGAKFRIEATKINYRLDFKVFAGSTRYDWREISGDEPF